MYEFTKIKQDENEGASPGRDDMMGVIAGLKEAQDELEEGSYRQEESRTTEGQIEEYAENIRKEKSRLEEMKQYLSQSQQKIEERLARMEQLEQAVQKIKENMKIIKAELSATKEMSEEISRQSKMKM